MHAVQFWGQEIIAKSCYYEDQKNTNVIITESDDLEIMVSENHDRKS